MESETEQRKRIVAIARTWLNTPFCDAQGLKGHGVDCGYFLARVYEEAGIWAPQPEPYYLGGFWNVGNSDEAFLQHVRQRGAREIGNEQVRPGDFVFFEMFRRLCHAAIIESWPDTIIHSIAPGGVVCSSANEGRLSGRKRVFFSVFASTAETTT